MPFELAIALFIILLIIGIICVIICWDDCPGGTIAGFGILFLSAALAVWMFVGGTSEVESESIEYYTPVMVTFEDGAKIQIIMAKGELINITAIFHGIVPEDKVVKKIIWKKSYCGFTFQNQKTYDMILVPKSEKPK